MTHNDNNCPKCNSNAFDWANVGLSNALECHNCGNIYPYRPPKPVMWPFPSKLIPFDGTKAKFNPENHEDALL